MIHRQIKQRRRDSGMTQEALCKAINESGGSIKLSTISRIESGKQSVTVDQLEQIAKILGPFEVGK